jgi:hypothetical protein
MSLSLNTLSEAYGTLLPSHWEKEENPQHYDRLTDSYVHSAPRRHILGLVGGNEVSLVKGNLVDLESDLRRINLPLTFAPWRQFQPPQKGQTEIVRKNHKVDLSLSVRKDHLPVYQMMAYPSVVAPAPLVQQVCVRPEKY